MPGLNSPRKHAQGRQCRCIPRSVDETDACKIPFIAAKDEPVSARYARGKVSVRGATADNGTVTRVIVNGEEAKALTPNFAEWEIKLDNVPTGFFTVRAHAEDAAGNVERRPHWVKRE
jgi:hypothetical protein